MNFSEEVWFMMILKVTKKQGFTLSLSRKDSLEKEQGWGGGGQMDPPSLFRVKSVSLEQMFPYTFAKTILSKMNCLLWDFALRFVSFSQQDRFVLVTHIFSLALIFLSSTQKCMMFSDKNPAKTILEHQFAKQTRQESRKISLLRRSILEIHAEVFFKKGFIELREGFRCSSDNLRIMHWSQKFPHYAIFF